MSLDLANPRISTNLAEAIEQLPNQLPRGKSHSITNKLLELLQGLPCTPCDRAAVCLILSDHAKQVDVAAAPTCFAIHGTTTCKILLWLRPADDPSFTW